MADSESMSGCTHFVCACCERIKPVADQHVVKAAYTAFNTNSQKDLRYIPYFVQLCTDCLGVDHAH